jgi:hypothetical protein
MKELLTKKFWQDVKKTFDEARDESPDSASEATSPSAANPKGITAAKDSPPPKAPQPSD